MQYGGAERGCRAGAERVQSRCRAGAESGCRERVQRAGAVRVCGAGVQGGARR